MLLIALSACTQKMPVQNQAQLRPIETIQNKDKGWYAVRFEILWEKEAEPNWSFGTLISGEVISPLLERHSPSIECWRVHRRAVRDATGHMLSFIFYSSQADAAILYQAFQQHQLLTELSQQHALLVKVTYDDLFNGVQTQLADTSDPVWPEVMRDSWPFFMMGVSQMWLEQVRDFKLEVLDEADLTQRYKLIQSRLDALWQEEGKHALIHHLNALYAYQPVAVRF